jgi:hypothetical protein
MEKWLCWGAMGIAGLLLILFILDLVTKSFPFGGLSTVVDILGAISCGLIAFLGWDAYKDLR